jgi:hypothetical protein
MLTTYGGQQMRKPLEQTKAKLVKVVSVLGLPN